MMCGTSNGHLLPRYAGEIFIGDGAIPPVDMAQNTPRYRQITVKGRRGYHVSFPLKREPYTKQMPDVTRGPEMHPTDTSRHNR